MRSRARSTESLSSEVRVVAVAHRIIVQTYLFAHECTSCQSAHRARMPRTIGNIGYGLFALEDEDERYAEDGEGKAYQVDTDTFEDGDGGADAS